MKNRKRNRLKGYDYSKDNLYFVTICVKERVCCLGAVGTGRSVGTGSSEGIGRSVGTGRDLSVRNNPDNNNPNENQSNDEISMQLNAHGLIVEDRINWLQEQYKYVEIHNFVVMPNHIHMIIEIDSIKVKDDDVKIKSLSSLVGALKTTSSKLIHESGFLDFAWQRSFHDHIIKTERAYNNIFNYIDLNPEKWTSDVFF